MTDQQAKRAFYAGLALSLSFVLAACGGGSDSGSTGAMAPLPAPVATSTPAASAPPAASPATPAAIDASCGLNGTAGIQAEVLQRVNALRAAGAVCGSSTFPATTPLNWNSLLLQAATGHSADMARNNYFSHTSQDGRNLTQRVLAAGYSYMAVGENIAAGQKTVESVMSSWINSPGHCQNMMNPTFQDIGVACVRNDAATFGFYWTMDLGRAR